MRRAMIAIAALMAAGFLASPSLARDVEERVDDRQDRREDVAGDVEENVDRRQDRREDVAGDVEENVDRRQDRREIIR